MLVLTYISWAWRYPQVIFFYWCYNSWAWRCMKVYFFWWNSNFIHCIFSYIHICNKQQMTGSTLKYIIILSGMTATLKKFYYLNKIKTWLCEEYSSRLLPFKININFYPSLYNVKCFKCFCHSARRHSAELIFLFMYYSVTV